MVEEHRTQETPKKNKQKAKQNNGALTKKHTHYWQHLSCCCMSPVYDLTLCWCSHFESFRTKAPRVWRMPSQAKVTRIKPGVVLFVESLQAMSVQILCMQYVKSHFVFFCVLRWFILRYLNKQRTCLKTGTHYENYNFGRDTGTSCCRSHCSTQAPFDRSTSTKLPPRFGNEVPTRESRWLLASKQKGQRTYHEPYILFAESVLIC